VRGVGVWARLLGLVGAVVEDVWIDDAGAVVVAARPEGARARSLPVLSAPLFGL
jgi:hypothetical protein